MKSRNSTSGVDIPDIRKKIGLRDEGGKWYPHYLKEGLRSEGALKKKLKSSLMGLTERESSEMKSISGLNLPS